MQVCVVGLANLHIYAKITCSCPIRSKYMSWELANLHIHAKITCSCPIRSKYMSWELANLHI